MATQPVDRPSDRQWTVDDYMALDQEDDRFEILQGELVVTPAPNFSHQRALEKIGRRIATHVEAHELGEVVYAPIDVVLADNTVVQPDFVYVAADRFDDIYDGHGFTGPPDLVVEVLSPSTVSRDRTIKRQIYADAGVSWLVHVDPRARTVEVFELLDERYSLADSASDDDSFALGLFADLSIELADVWLQQDDEDSQNRSKKGSHRD